MPARLDGSRAVVHGSETTEGEDVDIDEELEPTPERPGAGQALLRVEVIALETGKPLAGVILGLYPTEEEEEEGDREWVSSHQPDPSRGVEGDDVTTDASGRGEFVLQAGRRYMLRGYALHGLAGPGELELEPFAEAEQRDLRFALPTAWDLVWHGRVVDGETGLPLGGAEAVALDLRLAHEGDSPRTLATGRTDGDGRVIVRLPAWETMVVRFDAPGFFPGGCHASREADSFEKAAVVELLRPAALTAAVRDPTGDPIAGVEVRLLAYGFQLMKGISVADRDWTATTGEDGTCALAELPARVGLRVELRRGERVLARPKDPATGEDPELEPSSHRRIDWQLETGCALSGIVRDGKGEPLADVPLMLLELPYDARTLDILRMTGQLATVERFRIEEDLSASFRTDSSGRFALEAVPAGAWALGPSEEAEDLPRVTLALSVRPEERTKEVELVLDRGLYIRGVVLDPDGVPVQSNVFCRGDEPRLRSFNELQNWGSRDGTFRVGPLLTGSYLLQARPVQRSQAPSEPVPVVAGATNVVLRLRRGGELAGRVEDASSGEQVEAWVSLADGRSGSPTQGAEFLFSYLPAGTYDLVAQTKDGRSGILRSVRLAEREELAGLVIPVSPGANLVVRTDAPQGVFLRLEADSDGVLLGQAWGGAEPWIVNVLPGNVHVRWFRIGDDWIETLEHEERRFVASPGEETTLEYAVPR